MQLTILGSGTALPVPHRGPTGAWVRDDTGSVLIDCGSGTIQKLLRAGGDLSTLDGLLLTHAHLDHLGDLPFLLFALRQLPNHPKGQLTLVSSRALRPYLEGLSATFGDWLEPRGYIRVDRALEPGEALTLAGFGVQTYATQHHETSIGYRLESADGSSLAVTGDTELCRSLVDGVRNVDALVVECSFPDERAVEGHMTPSAVVDLLAETRPGIAILTHLYPEAESEDVVAQVRGRSSCPVLEAADGLTVAVAPGGVAEVGGNDRASPTEVSPMSPHPRRSDEEIRALMEAHLAELDSASITRGKYGDQKAEPQPPTPRRTRHWTPDALRGLRPSPRQRKLVERAAASGPLPEINLRGEVRDSALVKLRTAVQTWHSQSAPLARIITGKGLRSVDVPVLKLLVLNWLDSLEGQRYVDQWAPEMNRNRQFGSLVVSLHRW